MSVARPAGGQARNRALERRLLEATAAHAERWFGIGCGSYQGAVLRRLELGARRYGDDFFLDPDRDNHRELLEETPDVAGYALLVLQRLAKEPGGVPERVRDDLLTVMVLAAAADAFARRAGRRLREGRPRP